MLTLDDWITYEIGDQAPDLIVFMEIQPLAPAVADYFMSGVEQIADLSGEAFVDYIQNIHSVSPITPELDPITRKVVTSSMSIVIVDDGSIRQFQADGEWVYLGASVTLTIAPVSNPSVTAPLWKGVLKDMVPRDGLIEIRCADPLHIADEVTYYGSWWGNHPLELANELLSTVADIPSSMIDSTSLNPAKDTAIGHFCLGHIVGWPGVGLKQNLVATRKVKGLLDGLAFMLYASFYAGEDGKITYKRFGASTTVDRTWGEKEILSISQLSAWEGMINQVSFRIASAPGSDDEGFGGFTSENLIGLYEINDTASQARYAPHGGTSRISSRSFDQLFVAGRLVVNETITAETTAGITLTSANMGGMSGARMDDAFRGTAPIASFAALGGAWTQPAEATISGSRPLYLKLQDEIIKVTGVSFSNPLDFPYENYDKKGRVTGNEEYLPFNCSLTGVTRGTGAAAYDSSDWFTVSAWDVTSAHYVARKILDRAANGLPILEVVTSVAEFAVQIGDLVAIEDPDPLWLHLDGLDSSNIIKWEVIAKEFDPLARPATIKWKLAFAFATTDPWTKTIGDDAVEPDAPFGTLWVPYGWWFDKTGQSVSASTWQALVFDSAFVNEGRGWDGTSVYTVQKTGVYEVYAGARISALQDTKYGQLAIYVNGAAEEYGTTVYNGGASDTVADVQTLAVAFLFLSRGDTIEAYLYHDHTTSRNLITGKSKTYMSIKQTG